MQQYKTYRGETTSEALLKVKMDLGEGAEIVETREVEEGGWFGFFRDTFIEVEAYIPDESNGQTRNVGSNGGGTAEPGSAPGTAESSPDPQNLGRSLGGSQDGTEEAGQREWNVSEPAMPDFSDSSPGDQPDESPRDEARRLIERRQGGASQQESSPTTPTAQGTGTYQQSGQPSEEQADGSPDRSQTNEPETPQSVLETGDLDEAEAEALAEKLSDGSKILEQLMTNTDLLSEKLDSVLEKVDSEAEEYSQPQYPGQLQFLYDHLREQRVQESFARDLIGRMRTKLEPEEVDDLTAIRDVFRREVDRDFPPLTPLDETHEGPVVVPFIGPTGVGKTTTLAKLAAHFSVEERRSVGFITLDTYRLAAVEQLKRYADILETPIKDVIDQKEFHNAVQSLRNQQTDMIFVDTAGRSQFDEEKLEDLQSTFKGELDVVTHLVVDANSRFEDIETVLEGFGSIGFDRFVVTKLDETHQHGMVYNLLQRTDTPIAYMTDGQEVPNDLRMASAEMVTDLLFPGEDE